jgi:GT2 family glycosyltransferase
MNTTVAVVPRESFSRTEQSLDALLLTVPPDTPIVYVDGGSPRRVQRYIERAARARGITLVRTEHLLTPNEARNLALPHVETDYVVFVDNDILPTAGWLETLERCADETGAWAVGPLYLIGDPATERIHMAGGDAHITEVDGERHYVETHRYANVPMSQLDHELVREPTEQIEFHCMLLRRTVFDAVGPFDEGLMSQFEHIDVCMRIRALGHEVWFEPAARVTYKPTSFPREDVAYYLLRWSTEWNERSRQRFAERWDLPIDERRVDFAIRFCETHRHHAYQRVTKVLQRAPLGAARATAICERVGDAVLQPLVVRRAARGRRAAAGPAVRR